MKFRIVLWCCSVGLLAIMFSWNAVADMADINRIFHTQPKLDTFEICHGGGCAIVSLTRLTPFEWQQIGQIFVPMPETPVEERKRLAKAIGRLEKIVGNKVGTQSDRAGTFEHRSESGQLDCNDEAINTTVYMRLLKQAGWLRFHTIEDTRTRNFFFNGWPHSTAVIQELTSGERYAVDSWFFDNGYPATVVPLSLWKDNYFPPDSPLVKPSK